MVQHRVDQPSQHFGRVPSGRRFSFEQVGQPAHTEFFAVRVAGFDHAIGIEEHGVTGFQAGLHNLDAAALIDERVESERGCGLRLDRWQGCAVTDVQGLRMPRRGPRQPRPW